MMICLCTELFPWTAVLHRTFSTEPIIRSLTSQTHGSGCKVTAASAEYIYTLILCNVTVWLDAIWEKGCSEKCQLAAAVAPLEAIHDLYWMETYLTDDWVLKLQKLLKLLSCSQTQSNRYGLKAKKVLVCILVSFVLLKAANDTHLQVPKVTH